MERQILAVLLDAGVRLILASFPASRVFTPVTLVTKYVLHNQD
jgi:hypothetical protein